jgi:hypothetical protein
MAVIIGKQEDKPQEQPEVEVKPEKESIIEYTGKKMGAGWQAVRPPQEEEYDASTAPFVAFTPPNDMGVMSKISYRNSAGNVEYMFNRNEQEARKEINQREKWRKLSGEGYYFVQSDPDRYQDFLDKNDLWEAHSTPDNKLRRRTSFQSALVGPLRYQTKSIPENIYAMFSEKEDVNFTKYEWRRPTLTQDLGSFITRSVSQAGSIFDIFGNAFSGSMRELADFDAQRMEYFDEESPQSQNYAPYHVPDKEEIQNWLFKPEGDAMEQFATMLVGGGGQTALISKMFNTFERGKKIYHSAAKKTMRKLEKEGRDVPFVRGKDGKILSTKELAKRGIESPLGYNAAQRAAKGLQKPLSAKQIAGMSREQIAKHQREMAKRIAFKKQFNERVRRDFAKEIDAATVNKWAPIRFGERLMKKGALEAATNPVKFITQAGMAEVGLNGAMVLSSNLFSTDPDDNYALFGPMNLAIGIAGAMSSANLYSLSGAAIKTIGETVGALPAFRTLTGRETLLPIDALDVLLKNDQEADEAITRILAKYPRAKKRRVLEMVGNIAEAPIELRQDLIQNAEWSMKVIKDLRKTVFINDPDSELLSITLGELSNNKYLMTLENHLIGTKREGKTVSLNIIGADAVIKMKRAKSLIKLEEFLAKIDSVGMGTKLNPDTMQFIRNVETMAGKMRESLTPRAMENLKQELQRAIESKLIINSLGQTKTVGRSLRNEQASLENLLDIYKEFSKNFDDEATRLASIKNIALYSEMAGALKTQERLKKLIDPAGKGEGRANMGEVNNNFAKTYHTDGNTLRKEGSDAYEIARAKVQGLDITGEEAEDFVKNLNEALKPSKADDILNAKITNVKRAVEVSVRNNFIKNIEEFLQGENIDPAIIKEVLLDIHNNPLKSMTAILAKKNSGRGWAGISGDTWEKFNLELDILSQYDVQRAVNQAIGKEPSRSIINSNLASFKTKHNEMIEKFEATAPKGTAEDVEEYRAAVLNWKENVVPATTNNRIWQRLEAGRKYDTIDTFDKQYTEKILQQEFYENPTSFVQEATRLYGKFDPERGMHVIEQGSPEANHLNRTMKIFIDDIVSEEGERLAQKAKLEKINVKDFNQLIIPEDIKVTDLGFGEIVFGDVFDKKIANKIIKAKEATDTYNKSVGKKVLTIGDATERRRLYDEIVNENIAAQQALKKFDEEMYVSAQKLAGDTAELEEHINIIRNLSAKIDDEGLPKEYDFLNRFVLGSERALDDLYSLARKAGVNDRDFNKAIGVLTATGLRRAVEVGPLKESIKKITDEGAPLSQQMESLGVKEPNRIKRTILGIQEELPFAGKRPLQKIDPTDPASDVDMSKPFKEEVTVGLTVSREIDGLKLKGLLTEYEEQLVRAFGKGVNDPSIAEDHMKHLHIIADGLTLLQRVGGDNTTPEVLKASKTTIGGMASRFYAVFSGRVSWRYVGIEALYMHMARNEAAAITEILADPVASRAIAYMIAYGVPDFLTLKTSDQVSAWLPYVAMKSSHWYNAWREEQYDGFSSKKRKELQVEEEKRLMKEGIISRKEGFINMPEDEIRQP